MLTVQFGYFGRFGDENRYQTKNFRFSSYQNQNQTKLLGNRYIWFGWFGSAGVDRFRITILRPTR